MYFLVRAGSICSGDAPIDLLALTVPEEFVQFLSDYIQRNSLRDDLLDDIQTIWVSPHKHSNDHLTPVCMYMSMI